MSVAVAVSNLVRRFGPVEALRGATWSAELASITAVLGPNGAGKTTMIECLEGLQRPDGGEVRVLGVDPWRAPPEHRGLVGVMLQDGGLPNTVPPERTLRHLARLYADPADVDEIMATLGITEFRRTPTRRLSGGQRQRVALAAAIIGRPRVVFLDEPSAGLDPHARRQVWELIRGLRIGGACVVVTTHSFDEAERLAERVVILDRGHVVADDTVAALTENQSLESLYFGLTEETA